LVETNMVDTTKYTALIIPDDDAEAVRVERLEYNPEVLEGLVCGVLEDVIRGDWCVYLNAEGHSANHPVNARAARLMQECGVDDVVVPRGTAVFLGRGRNWGSAADVPEHLIRRAEQLFGGSGMAA
jgi:hypothetical protein